MKISNLNARLKRSIKSHWRASVSTVLLLLSLSAAAVWYGCTPNTAARLWGVDDTTWVTYAKNMDGTGPTADHPVYIEAQAERLYGLKIGTPMRVHYIIKTTSDVKPQFDTLMQGVLLHYKSPWRLVARPQPPSHDTKDGITTWDLEVTVAVWEPPSVDGEPGKPIDFIEPPNADPAPAKAAEPGAEQPAKADLSGAPPESSANQSAEPRLWPFKLEFLVLSGKPIKRQYIETPPLNFGFSS